MGLCTLAMELMCVAGTLVTLILLVYDYSTRDSFGGIGFNASAPPRVSNVSFL